MENLNTLDGSAQCGIKHAIRMGKVGRYLYTKQELADYEAEIGIRLPDASKKGYLVGATAQIWKNRELCTWTEEKNGVQAASFYGLTSLSDKYDLQYYRGQYGEEYGVDMSGMISFGGNGDLFLCLDYHNNPDVPEVWNLDMDVVPGLEGYYFVAKDFDTFLEALVPEKDLISS